MIIDEAERGSKIYRNSAGNSLNRSQSTCLGLTLSLVSGGNKAGTSTLLTDRKFVSANSFTGKANGSSMVYLWRDSGR